MDIEPNPLLKTVGRMGQKAREEVLARHGINGKQQHFATHLLNQIQQATVMRVDELCIKIVQAWFPFLRGKKPKHFSRILQENNCLFAATSKDNDPISGWHKIIYCGYRKEPETKRAMEVRFRAMPVMNDKGRQTGSVKIEVENKEIPWPETVRIKIEQ